MLEKFVARRRRSDERERQARSPRRGGVTLTRGGLLRAPRDVLPPAAAEPRAGAPRGDRDTEPPRPLDLEVNIYLLRLLYVLTDRPLSDSVSEK